MRNHGNKFAMLFVIAATLVTCQFFAKAAMAESSFFTSQGCSSCHSAPTTATCNGCHAHGSHGTSAKSSINVTGTTNKTSYAPGETVSVTIAGGYRSGWIRAVLYDQNNVELARSTGSASGMGSSTTYPATLTAPAPAASGTYSWKVAWYGNQFDAAGAKFGTGWTPDPNNPNHGEERVSTNTFTVVAAGDSAAPTVNTFTLPATATSLTVAVSALSASDNVGVTGYLITTSATAPTAASAGWSATAPTTATAAAAGSVTFYAWAKDAAGNVSLSKSATVNITLPTADTTAPTVDAFTLPATATSLTVAVTALSASDNVGVTGYLITTSATAPTAASAGWSATAPTTVTAAAAGDVIFYAWAKDGAGNVSLGKSATVTITLATGGDNPVLLVSTLDDGAVTNKPTLNVTGSVTDPDGIKTVTLNDKKVKLKADGSFTAICKLKPGVNTVKLTATDNKGNQSVDSRTITFDKSAPQLTIDAPADHMKTSESFITVNGTVNETSTVKVSVNGGAPEFAAINGNSFTATVYLTTGVNTVIIKATDLAGNSSSLKRTVFCDDGKPTLAVTSPEKDMTTKKQQILVKGKVKGTDGELSVSIVMDGTTYTPAVVKGKFAQPLTFPAAGEYDIVVTATDANGSSSVHRIITYQPKVSDDDVDDD